ncbi:MAG: MFS transporter [Chloroflexi bacterium]|nr:MFS transporter [Chloroflexota bacterium]
MFRRRADAGSVGESIEAAASGIRRPRSAKSPRPRRSHVRAHRIPRPLQHPAFFRLWSVSLLAYLSRFTDYAIVAWLVGQYWDSPLAIGILIFFRFSPFLFIGPVFGLIADRFPRILIVRIAQAGTGSISLLFGLLLIAALAPLWVLYVYVFLNGMLFVLDMPARRTYFTGVVGRRYITSALALDMISLNMAWFVGSNVAGVLLDTVDPGFVYLGLGAIGFLNVILLRGLPVLFRPTNDERVESFVSSFRKGLRFVRGNRVIIGLLIAVGLTNLSGYTFESMIAVIAREQFNAGPLLFGLLISAQGMGALVVAVVLATTRWRVRRHGLMVLSMAFLLHLLAAGLTWLVWAPFGFALLLILGMIAMGFSIMHNSMLLMLTPDRMRGRIIGIQIVVLGMFPLGSLGLGALAQALGAAEAMRIVAFGGMAILLVIMLVFPELRRPTETIE